MSKISQQHAAELMPQDIESQNILRERALQLAEQEESPAAQEESVPYICFTIAENEFYGVPYQYSKEVIRNPLLTKPPRTPEYVCGVINWRGALVLVLDLKRFFHTQNTQNTQKLSSTDKEYIIIVSINGITLGILAKTIEGSKAYHPSGLQAPLLSTNVAKPEYIIGLDQAVIAIINLEAIVSALSKILGTGSSAGTHTGTYSSGNFTE